MRIFKLTSMILLFCFIVGCTSVPTTLMDYTPTPIKTANKINGTLVVRDFKDARPPRHYEQAAARAWLAYVPLLPYVNMNYERIEESYDISKKTKTSSLASLSAESIANDIKSMGIFNKVLYIGDKELPDHADYVMTGTLKSSEFNKNITTYMLGAPGVLLWFLPIPIGSNNALIGMTMNIENHNGKTVWSYDLNGKAGKLHTLYNEGGIPLTRTLQIKRYGSNDEGINENSIFAYHASALRSGMVAAKKSLLQKLPDFSNRVAIQH